jgi:hypothetical protein
MTVVCLFKRLRYLYARMPLMKPLLILCCLLLLGTLSVTGQQKAAKAAPGLITGNVIDTLQKAIADASVTLRPFIDSLPTRNTRTDQNGNFEFEQLPFGYYKLSISYVGFRPLTLDSIWIRAERYDFNMSDLILKPNTDTALEEVVVYAEKPLIESRDGNITFNAGESALSAGSNAAELLKSVPLVANDPDGKLVVRGREPKILIDDKPVELNAQQLADLLESLPGSMIERIEVMTNPPPQYANEQGGVINIVTKKGKVGMGARITLTAGSRGEYGASGNINYRKKGLAVNLNMGFAYNEFDGYSRSMRENFRTDSTNYYATAGRSYNKGIRPNARLNVDYELDKYNIFNLVMTYSQAVSRNKSDNEYTNINRFHEVYRISQRSIATEGSNISPVINFTYTHKSKKPGESLRFIAGTNTSWNNSNRTYYEIPLNPDNTQRGKDSTQLQFNETDNKGYNARINYDKLLDNKKTSFSTGGSYVYELNDIDVDVFGLRNTPVKELMPNSRLSNSFDFRQQVSNIRVAVKQRLSETMSVTSGITLENTDLRFTLKDNSKADNNYSTWLPFFTFSKKWEDILSVNLSYRKSIRRPGINQMNPTVDIADTNNIRFGNPGLLPSTSHNFDMVFGRTTDNYFLNLSFGYNKVADIFSQLRLPAANDTNKTTTSWYNIDGREEFEISTWNGYTFSKALRVNLSASYTFNKYNSSNTSFINGGTFTSNFNGNFVPTDLWNITTGINFNRFANPQGTVRSNLRMNFGVQRKFFGKKLVVTVNIIDPIAKQEYRSFTTTPAYNIESLSSTNTRNYRLTIGYNFTQLGKKKSPPKKTAGSMKK